MISIGDTVKLKTSVARRCNDNRTATVEGRMSVTYSGGRILNRELGGSKIWNIKDLEKVQ